jgi:jumonji domain-containing protein 2
VNKPYLYVGSWKTMFAWHKEDLDLGAINFLHYGKTKFWYAIARDDQHYLEKMAKMYFADNFAKCNQFLRHKTTIINPYLLKKTFPQIKIHKVRQEAGEFIIVFPGSYHHGFNHGFNIAEAVNYATVKWLPMFLEAKSCRCISDMVKINKKEFYENLIRKRPEMRNNPYVVAFKKSIEELEQLEKAKVQ